MAYILHIDTSGDKGLVALAKDGKILSIKENADTRNHAAVINIHIEELLTESNISLADIAAFCVCGGPGSYTGLRIGLATAKGFCYAMDKPLMMHNKLAILAMGASFRQIMADVYIAVLQAREGEYFIAAYDKETNEVAIPQHITEAQLATFAEKITGKKLCTGFVNDAVTQLLQKEISEFAPDTTINIDAWATYGYCRYNCNDFVNLANSEPFYLKQVYTHKPKNIN